MSVAPLWLIKRCIEWRRFVPDEIRRVPHNTRGIYVLYQSPERNVYNVMYVGMAGGPKAGIHGRLRNHLKSRTKSKSCTHFSIFEVHDNVREGA